MRSALVRTALLAAIVGACDDGGPALLVAPLTRSEAAQMVLDALLGPAPATVIVMGRQTPVMPGDEIGPYVPPDSDASPAPLPIARESWFFWIDDMPGAQFTHPCRFVLVERDTGLLAVTDQLWWPVLNGETLWPGDGDAERADRVFSNVTEPRLAALALREQPALAQAAAPGHFVGVNAWRPGELVPDSFEDDMTNMLELWGTAGFETTWFADPDNYIAADGPPSVAAVRAELERLANETTGPVVILLTGHGHVRQDGSVQVGRFHEDKIYELLELFPPDRDVSLIINGCHTGGMLEGRKGKLRADVVVTATDAAGESWGDADREMNGVPDPNPRDTGSEFVSSVYLGVLETAQENPGDLPSAWIRKAFPKILEYDQTHRGGFTFPQISEATSAPTTFTVLDVSAVGSGRPVCVGQLPQGRPWLAPNGDLVDEPLVVGLEDPNDTFAGGLAFLDPTDGSLLEHISGGDEYAYAHVYNAQQLLIFAEDMATSYNPDIKAAGAVQLYIQPRFRNYARESATSVLGVDVISGIISRFAIDASGFPTTTIRAVTDASTGRARCATVNRDDGLLFCATQSVPPQLLIVEADSTVPTHVADLTGECLCITYCAGWLWTTDRVNDLLRGFRVENGAVVAGGPHFEQPTGDEPVCVAAKDLGNGRAACWTVDLMGLGGACIVWDTTTRDVVYARQYELPNGLGGCAYLGLDEREENVYGACPVVGRIFRVPLNGFVDLTAPGYAEPPG